MVLNVVDEIINGTPKYNITENSDGTKEIELANDIVVEGTPLNKNIFNKIENVLSYQIPTYEEEEIQIQGNPIINNADWENYSVPQVIQGGLNFDYLLNGSSLIKLNVTTSGDAPNFSSGLSGSQQIIPTSSISWKDYIDSNNTTPSNSSCIRSTYRYHGIIFTWDFGDTASFTFNYTLWRNSTSDGKWLYSTSNDGINWSEETEIVSRQVADTLNISNVRYFRFYAQCDTTNGIAINRVKFTNVTINTKKVNYILNTLPNVLANNQIVNIQTPNVIASDNTIMIIK